MKETEIRILPFIAYNQLQALEFGLNHTQAIIMNYMVFLPIWAIPKQFNNKNYFKLFISKGLKDMPTLDIKETSMRNNIKELITKGLLEREIEANKIPYYRVTEKWITGYKSNPSESVDNIHSIINQIEKKKDPGDFASKLMVKLSSYVDDKEKTKPSTVFDLSNIDGGEITQYIAKILREAENGSGLKVESKTPINQEYIDSVTLVIVDLAKRFKKFDTDTFGNPSNLFVANTITELEKIVGWYTSNNKVIKSFNSVVRNWFSKYYNK